MALGLVLTDNPVGFQDRHQIAPLSFLAAKATPSLPPMASQSWANRRISNFR